MAVVLLIPNSNPTSLTLSISLSPPNNHHNHRHHILRPTTSSAFKPQRFSVSPSVSFPLQSRDRDRDRSLSLVTRAGPSTNSYILAFVLPFSLVVITVLTSIRISDKLDQDYLEEVIFQLGFVRSGGTGFCCVCAYHVFDKSPELFCAVSVVLLKAQIPLWYELDLQANG